jgi:hypothetical protein
MVYIFITDNINLTVKLLKQLKVLQYTKIILHYLSQFFKIPASKECHLWFLPPYGICKLSFIYYDSNNSAFETVFVIVHFNITVGYYYYI